MSKFDMDEDFYNEALEKAVDKRQSSGQFSLDGSRWIYNVRSTDSGYILVFLDVTARKEILTNLISTFSTGGDDPAAKKAVMDLGWPSRNRLSNSTREKFMPKVSWVNPPHFMYIYTKKQGAPHVTS
ncbi:hypothetical protein ABHN00_01050 [Paenibacillus phoenicis]